MATERTLLQSSLDSFLEDNPNILFEALRPQTASRSFTDYWRGRYGSVLGDYIGGIGRTALKGTIPTEKFQDFVGEYPWTAYWEGLSPSARGERPSMYAPRTRWNMAR
jgi:hypothetical protein